jgi:hypothetical protein
VVDFSVTGSLTLCWGRDGKKVLVTNDGGDGAIENVLVDVESGKTGAIELPTDVRVLDWSRDGKTFLALFRKDKKYRFGLVGMGDKQVRELTELKVRAAYDTVGRFSPDGKKVLFTDADPARTHEFKWHKSNRPHVLEVATGKRESLADFPENAQCLRVTWSPDGSWVAYTWVQLHVDLLKKDVLTVADTMIETEAFLIIADADGKSPKTVAPAKASNALRSRRWRRAFGTDGLPRRNCPRPYHTAPGRDKCRRGAHD